MTATYARRYKRKQRDKLDALKATPCMDCGRFFPPECMDFDHRPDEEKVMGVGYMVVAGFSWSRIMVEVAKCDIVCANCHRIRTRKRLRDSQVL